MRAYAAYMLPDSYISGTQADHLRHGWSKNRGIADGHFLHGW